MWLASHLLKKWNTQQEDDVEGRKGPKSFASLWHTYKHREQKKKRNLFLVPVFEMRKFLSLPLHLLFYVLCVFFFSRTQIYFYILLLLLWRSRSTLRSSRTSRRRRRRWWLLHFFPFSKLGFIGTSAVKLFECFNRSACHPSVRPSVRSHLVGTRAEQKQQQMPLKI